MSSQPPPYAQSVAYPQLNEAAQAVAAQPVGAQPVGSLPMATAQPLNGGTPTPQPAGRPPMAVAQPVAAQAMMSQPVMAQPTMAQPAMAQATMPAQPMVQAVVQQSAQMQQPSPPDARVCYRQGALMKRPVDGCGGDKYRRIVLWGNRIEWCDGSSWRGSLALNAYSSVDYSPHTMELIVKEGSSIRMLVLYPQNRGGTAADEMLAWISAIHEVIRQAKEYHAYVEATRPRVQYVTAPYAAPGHYHHVHHHHGRHHQHHHRGGRGDVALAVGGGLLAGAMLGAMLD